MTYLPAFFPLTFLFPIAAYALFFGNPDFPEIPEEGVFSPKESWFDLKLGYQGDLAFDRKMKLESSSLRQRVDTFQISSHAGMVAFDFWRRLEVYGAAGAMEAKIVQMPQSGILLEYETRNQLFWEAGLKALLIYWGDSRIGCDFKWMQSTPKMEWLTMNQQTLSVAGGTLHYREWQVGLGISHRISELIPYLGVFYSSPLAQFKNMDSLEFLFPNRHFTMKSRSQVGLALGCSLAADRAFEMNVEVRMLAEAASTLSATLQF